MASSLVQCYNHQYCVICPCSMLGCGDSTPMWVVGVVFTIIIVLQHMKPSFCHFFLQPHSQLFDSEDRSSERRDSASSLGEDPPIVEMIYRRSFKDLFKLILLPAIYFLFMVVAVIFAFYTIQGLVLSYSNHVQSVQIKKVDNAYDPVGIVIMPQFSSYVGCDYRYFDDLSPNKTTVISCGNLSIPVNCTHVNVTFNSTIIEGATRKAMVFRSPTLVYCKQNLRIHYMIDTGVREFSAVEYMLLPSWEHFISSDLETQRNQLADLEKNSIIYTFPSGFRTWVKLSYSVRINSQGEVQSPEFYVRASYATYTSTNMTEAILPMEVVFEWASPFYNQIQEVISTTAFSAIGSLCGIFITLIKAGEFCRMWLRRIRREKQKKLLHLQELEKRQQELLEDYERRKKERREAKLKAKSMLEDSSKKDSLP